MATHLDQELADGIRQSIDTFLTSRRRFGVQSIPVIKAVVVLEKNNAPENVQTFFRTVRKNIVAFENALDSVEMLYQAIQKNADQVVTYEDLENMADIGEAVIIAHNDGLIHLKENMGEIVEYLDNEMDGLLGEEANNDLINAIGNTASFGDWFGNSIHMLVSLALVVAQGDSDTPTGESGDAGADDVEGIANLIRATFGGAGGTSDDA